MARKNAHMDFRYDSGPAKVPWGAVGEYYRPGDVAEFVRFLLPARRGCEAGHRQLMARLAADLERLGEVSTPAAKLSLGGKVREAEAKAAKFFGVKYACFQNNWTAGMEVAYKLAGLKPGDEVIVPPLTFIASVAYPLSIGAKVVFADVDPRTVNLDPKDVARKVSARTRAIMPVHIGGHPVDMDPLMEIAGRNGICVIEDAAHGMGAKYKGRYLGTIGHFGGFSLHEVKNINALGEGGLLVSNHELGAQFSRGRFLGLDFSRRIPNWLYDVAPLYDRYGKPHVPGNSSATEIQAVGFLVHLARLKRILAARKKNAQYLRKRFAGEKAIRLPPADTAETFGSHHLFLLAIDPEEAGGDVQILRRKLKEKGVTEIPHFGPLYKFQMLRELGYDGMKLALSCPVAEEMFNRRFTHLPVYGLSPEQLEYMADAVLESIGEMRAGR